MPVENEVIGNDPTTTPPVPEKDTKAADTVTMTRAEADGLKRERDEARESERFWSTQARSHGRTAEPAAEPEEVDTRPFLDEDEAGPDDDTPEKLVNDLAAKGTAGLKARGFITASDAKKLAAEIAIKVSRQMIGEQNQRTSSDTAIMSQFPELKDQNSELFKATAKIYQEAVAMDPGAQKTPAALYLAAKAAKASLKPAPKAEDDDDELPERESDRRRRAESQDSRPKGRGTVDDRDDMLGDEARQVIKAMGITEEEYKASRKEIGVSAGRGRRR